MMIEDNETDILRASAALRQTDVPAFSSVHTQAERALVQLRDETHALPDLILLDLSLPGISGLEFLEEVKADARLRSVPVCTLSSSEAGADIARTWELGVVGYIVKPVKFSSLIEALRALTDYFFDAVSLPSRIGRLG